MTLAEEIEAVFRDAVYPAGDPISESRYDEGTTNVFAGTHWRDHSPQQLEFHTFALNVMTPQAFAFFLPAFLLGSLRPDVPGLRDSLITKLCPPKHDVRRPSYFAWWQLLTTGQRRVIIEFLKLAARDNPGHLDQTVASLENHVGV